MRLHFPSGSLLIASITLGLLPAGVWGQVMARPSAPPAHAVAPHPAHVSPAVARPHFHHPVGHGVPFRWANYAPYVYYGGYYPYYAWDDYGYGNYADTPAAALPFDFDFDAPPAYSPPRSTYVPPVVEEHPNTARLALQTPPGADVWIQGKKHDVGTSHTFESPELQPGETFTFDVRVTWKENGKQVEEKRQLSMKAGDFQSLQYLAAPSTPVMVNAQK